ncbi:MAG: uroporphyrinogen decarboxylase family protein, partial [Chloroflexota bacterium]
WKEMTPDEKLQKRIDAWLAEPINFVSAQAEADYKARINRFLDAVTLRKIPDRVPVMPGLGAFAQHYYGYTQKDMMYDPDKANEVSMKATLEFQIDVQITVGDRVGLVMDIIVNKNNRWPGHGVPDDGETQFLEAENLKADEYDAFMRDPTDFGWRVITPRTTGALEPFAKLSAASHRGPNVADFGRPEIQAAFMKLMEAGKAQVAFQQKTAAGARKLKELGYPVTEGSTTGAPFDSIGDSLRGTVGIVEDMFKRPEKLLEALEWFTSRNIERGLAGARMGNAPVVAFHLHKGSDTYMSDEQFRTFYWPSLRKVMLGLINEGLIVSGGNQGFHNKRLEYYRDVPKGKVFWSVGYGTDIARAKEVLGGVSCIRGGITADILHHGTPEEVEGHVRHVMDIAKKGGGYIFSTSNMDSHAKVENVKAMIASAKKYGVY